MEIVHFLMVVHRHDNHTKLVTSVELVQSHPNNYYYAFVDVYDLSNEAFVVNKIIV